MTLMRGVVTGRSASLEDQVLHQADSLIQSSTAEDTVERVSPGARHPAATTFPSLLRTLRDVRGWTKADLAKRAGFDPSTITRLEQGTRAPERETVLQLAEAMALPMPDRDRLLAAGGYRSDTWDDPDLVEIAAILADPAVPLSVRGEIRTVLRMAISHGRLRRMQSRATQTDT